MNDTIKLSTKKNFRTKENIDKSTLIIDKFIESCMALDISIFEPYMSEDDVFEDLEKYEFLLQLRVLFTNLRMQTNSKFSITFYKTACNGCIKGDPVLQFQVYSEDYESLKIDFGYTYIIKDGILIDIYKCLSYDGRLLRWNC